MYPRVKHQVLLLGEPLLAELAFKRPLSRVHGGMGLQIENVEELHAANVAGDVPLFQVDPPVVSLEVRLHSEHLVAFLALELGEPHVVHFRQVGVPFEVTAEDLQADLALAGLYFAVYSVLVVCFAHLGIEDFVAVSALMLILSMLVLQVPLQAGPSAQA